MYRLDMEETKWSIFVSIGDPSYVYMYGLNYGTGSNPPGLNGLQRQIRHAPIAPPLMTPYRSMAV